MCSMTESLPASTTYAVIGAGIHGLSTAWHLAMELEARSSGSGKDIVVLDKSGPGAGASGIACGCVRNLYMTEPLHAILRHSVDVWTHDPVALGFQQVGYVGLALHAKVSGYAGTRQAVSGLAAKCGEHGVRVIPGVEVTGYDVQGGSVRAVLTSQGRMACDAVIWGLGAWTPKHWAMLGKPDTVE